MAGTLVEDYTGDGRSSSTDELPSDQQSHSGESLAEWRSSEQVENGTPSTSPVYSDTDDDDCGPRPSELYGKFTWRIDNFSQINKRELRSNSFDVGGYKWYILIYPQGCDVCNHLSLFLCVANHDKLLPGWSHFAQFTIAVINRDPKKSKYSDTLHRFWKKEHDWGWKKFMELSKLHDGFVVEDVLTIKAQVQVIREKADSPFRCLDGQYRRELVRVYLSNVEQICRRFIDERRSKLCRLIEDRLKWSSFNAFWLGMDASVRGLMTRERTDTILKVLVKHFFIEKEVTSTLVMDSLYSGLKALEYQSKNKKGMSKLTETDVRSTSMVLVDQDMFVLADDVILLLERATLDTLPHQPLPTKDDKSSQNRTKDGSSGDDFNKDSIERDDRRLIELGWKTLEFFALAHIFSRIEVAYQEAVALKRQEELIREEEAAGLAEIELRAKRSAAEKEKRIRKKQAKQKKNSRKNNKGKNERLDMKEIAMDSSPSDDRILDDFSSQAEEVTSNADNPEEVSDVSDNRDDNSEVLHIDLEDRESSPVNWETDASETQATVPEGGEVQNEQAGKRTSFVDDSSSTCSSDSVPSVISNGSYMGGAWTNVKSSSNRGNNRRNKDSDTRTGLGQGGSSSAPNGIFGSGNSKDLRHESEDDKVVLQKKQNAHRHVDVTSPSKLRMTESSFSSVCPVKKQPIFSQQPKSSFESTNNLSSRASEVSGAAATTTRTVTSNPTASLVPTKGPPTIPATQNERSVASRPLQVPAPSKSEAQKQTSLALGTMPEGRCAPWLFAVALVAAWICAAASSSPEQAGSSQKSVNCMPCSRTYVADAYLDDFTSQLARHRDLTEVPGSADLCKGLAGDLDVPTLSELHRQLVGEGSHRSLVYSVKFGNCQDAMVNFLDGCDANLVITEKLPSGVFADPFELQHFVERKVFLDVAVFGDTNLELPSALSNQSAVEIHFDLKPSTSMNCNLVVELPLHARYPPLDASGYATVEFVSPDLLLRYRKKEIHSDSCLWALKNLDAVPMEKAVWRIPCGDEAHIGLVSTVTFLSALVCSMSIVLAASLIP